jgi:hypothetical protein
VESIDCGGFRHDEGPGRPLYAVTPGLSLSIPCFSLSRGYTLRHAGVCQGLHMTAAELSNRQRASVGCENRPHRRRQLQPRDGS